jgi:dienelactone hydrolase
MKKGCVLLALAILFGLAWPSVHAEPIKPSPVPSAIEAKAMKMVALLAKEDYDRAGKDFNKEMQKALPAKKLADLWKSLTSKVGTLKKQTGVRTERAGKHDIVFVSCAFAKTPLDIKVVFTNAKEITGLFFAPSKSAVKYEAPDYVQRKAFRETEVKFGLEKWTLPGTLSLPGGEGPFPVVVLVHGSGPSDRDETIGPNQPFRDLAWGLASRGIAVFRYEKRTKEHGAKMTGKNYPTVKEEVIDDALAAVTLLRKTKGIDAKKIFVLGLSLGGTLVPQIGIEDPAIAGLISLAGLTRPLEEAMLEQITYLASLQEKLSDEEKAQMEKAKKQLARVADPKLSPDTPASELPLSVPAKYWLSLRNSSPAQAAGKCKQPILVLQGERDYQVTMKDFQGWKKLLVGRKNTEFKSYAKLNHLFIAGEGKSKPTEYDKVGHVAKEVIEDIAGWIKKQ